MKESAIVCRVPDKWEAGAYCALSARAMSTVFI